MKKIIYAKPNGSVSIVTLSIKPDRDIDQAITLWFTQRVPSDATNVQVIDTVDIPTDRTFRNAWENKTTHVEVNMPKARIMHMDVIRKIRDIKLKILDTELMIAQEQQEQGDIALATSLISQKQVLRDIPQIFDLTVATTPDELKILMPSELK